MFSLPLNMENLPSPILCRILQKLSILDLLLSQRVCRSWRSIIQETPALQGLLFLAPSSGPFEGTLHIWDPDESGGTPTEIPIVYPDILSGMILFLEVQNLSNLP